MIDAGCVHGTRDRTICTVSYREVHHYRWPDRMSSNEID